MFCTRCGASLDEGNAFCTKCGAPVEQADARASSSERTEVLRDNEEPAGNECEASGNGAGGSKSGKRYRRLIVFRGGCRRGGGCCVYPLLMPKASVLLWMIPLPKIPSRRRRKTKRPREMRRQRKSLLKATIYRFGERAGTTETESIAGSPAPEFSFDILTDGCSSAIASRNPRVVSSAHPDDGVEVFFTQGESSHPS